MTTTSTRLCDAQDARDLIPGDIQTIVAAQADLDRAGVLLTDTATALATIATSTPAWSGPAAAAFTRHTRDVGDTLGRWEHAHHQVSQALTDYQDQLAAAQNTAAHALLLWRTARAHLAQLTGPGAGVPAPSNLESLRARVTAMHRRATVLLERARTDLAAAGETAAGQITAATHQLHDHPLPALTHQPTAPPPTSTTHMGLAGPPNATVTVLPPHAGIHDSLSRIAARTLGDARRWPEIYRLNTDRLGHHPNLIQPGWILRLPTDHTRPAPGPDARVHQPPVPADTSPSSPLRHPTTTPTPVPPSDSLHALSPTTTPPGAQHPTPPAPPDLGHLDPPDDGPGGPLPTPSPTGPTVPVPAHPLQPQPHPAVLHTGDDGGGVHLGNGAVLAGGVLAGLAGIVGAAAILRHQHGTTGADPSDLDVAASPPPGSAPVVRTLTADPTGRHAHDGGGTHGSAPVPPEQCDLPLGEHDGRTVLLDAATTFGLGLTGPGALPAARALLLSVLTGHPAAHAVLTADDLHALGLPPAGTGQAAGGRVSVPAQPDDALAHLEAAILTRTRLLEESAGQHTPPPLLLVISVPADPRRLQAIADLGAGLAITVLILGPWPAGLTCHVGTTGQITTRHTAQDPDWAASLNGVRAYTADADTTRELLALLDQRPIADQRPPDPATPDPTTPPIPQPTSAPVTHHPTAHPGGEHDQQPGDIAHRLTPPGHASPPLVTAAASDAARGHTPRPRTPDSPTSHPASTPIHLAVVGHFQVLYHAATTDTPTDLTDRFSPREREILTYLAVHPDGTRRDTLIAALWPDHPGDRPSASLHARLSHIRHTLRTVTDNRIESLTTHHNGYYALDPAIVDVDLWQLTEALHTHYHATDPRERTAALHEIAQLYRGQLADTITGDWIDIPRQALHRDALDAFATLIRALCEDNPDHALDLLEHARTLDPHNEAIYRDIIRLQQRLGHHDSVPRTIELLRTALAEIDATPMPSTLALASGSPASTMTPQHPASQSPDHRPIPGSRTAPAAPTRARPRTPHGNPPGTPRA